MIADSVDLVINWLNNNIVTFLTIVCIFLAAAVLVKVLSHVFTKLLRRTIRSEMFPSKNDREKRISTLDSIASAIISFTVWFISILMILSTLGINIAPILASAGILGVALGFGAQSLVRDFITGMFIIAENQYRVGDYVEIQNVRGTVKAVTMRTTVVRDDDGSIFHIPNGSIIVTGNHTMSNNKVSIEISASTETDIEHLRKLIDKTGVEQSKSANMKEIIIEPLQFRRIKEISGGSVSVRILGKVISGKQNDVKSDYLIALQKELVKNKIALK